MRREVQTGKLNWRVLLPPLTGFCQVDRLPSPDVAFDNTAGNVNGESYTMRIDAVDEDKYVAVLEFLLDQRDGANNSLLGKVKLMKLLYFADFDHFFKHGQSITGDTYVKLDFGPVPQNADRVLYRMKHTLEELEVDRVSNGIGFQYVYRLTSKSAPAREHLSPEEQRTLQDVVERWRDARTDAIVTASHGDPPWRMVPYGSRIPYHLVRHRSHISPINDEEPPPQQMRVL